MKNFKFIYLLVIIFLIFFSLPVKPDTKFDLGKDVFLNKAMCSSCHTLRDAGSNAQIGPNLNEIKPDKFRIINAVTNGVGVMPAFEGQLTIDEIEAVAHYVSISSSQ